MKDKKDKLLTDENLEMAERALLEASGLQPDEYEIRKIIVDKELNHYMSTVIIKSKTDLNLNHIKACKNAKA